MKGMLLMSVSAIAASIALVGCVIGAPPGFSKGDTWTFPLVDPLADDRLIVPVYLDGSGPYLFVLEPDGDSLLDPEAAEAAQLLPGEDLRHVQIGDLTISSLHVRWIAPHSLDVGGRRIFGAIGREAIADSLVFGFDRERGIAWLRTEKAFRPPNETRMLDCGTGRYHGAQGFTGVLVTATIDGVDRLLRIDLENETSKLRRSMWVESKLEALAPASGHERPGDAIATARQVIVQSVEQWGVRFTEFSARSPYYGDGLDGTLGLGFFTPFSMALDWYHRRVYLSPRADAIETRAQRLARWGPRQTSCRQLGCLGVQLGGRQLLAVPETPDRNVEVVLRASTPSGEPLPDLEVNAPMGSVAFTTLLDERYQDATIAVIDASPFPRTCAFATECAAPMSASPVPSSKRTGNDIPSARSIPR